MPLQVVLRQIHIPDPYIASHERPNQAVSRLSSLLLALLLLQLPLVLSI
jgi:hypothetical protein